jgi:hypothetical protein
MTMEEPEMKCFKCGAPCQPQPGEEGDIEAFECYECGVERAVTGQSVSCDAQVISYALGIQEFYELRNSLRSS